MQTVITEFSSRQTMKRERLEFYHYKDVSFGKVHPHMHSHYELYFFLNGETNYVVGDREFHLKKGDFLIIEPNQLHFPEVKVAAVDKPYERFVLWINPDYLNKLQTSMPLIQETLASIHSEGSCHFRPDTKQMQRILGILEDMITEDQNQEVGHSLAIETLFVQLLIQIHRVINNKRAYQAYNPSEDLYSQVVRYIHTNIKENISLDMLSAEFYVSRSYISRIFRQHLDISVHQYIIRLKLDGVMEEIRRGVPLTDASYEYGFTNYSTFYRQCQKEFGVSPKELLEEILPAKKEIFLTDGETF